MTIGNKLLNLRKKAGIDNQAEMYWLIFGGRDEVSKPAAQSKWKRFELDQQEPTLQELASICRFFKVPVSHFIEGEVVQICGILQCEHVETICRKIGVIYSSGNVSAINSLECHLEGLVSMITNRETVNEIMNALKILVSDNQDFHLRLNNLENLIKTETPDVKADAEEERGETAASSSGSQPKQGIS